MAYKFRSPRASLMARKTTKQMLPKKKLPKGYSVRKKKDSSEEGKDSSWRFCYTS